MSKHLISINDFSKEEIYKIFEMADKLMKNRGTDKLLQGKTVVLFFPESSIRTRITFEKGIQELGGRTILFPPSDLDKKEKIEDVVGYLENWVDAIVVRHSDIEVVKRMAKYASIPVINAMTSENHPCEIISDMYSLSKIYGNIENKKFLFVGVKGNIGNSWKEASQLMGFDFEQCCPVKYELENVKNYSNIHEAILGKDIICTDSIPDYAKEDFKDYQITLQCMEKANEGALLNPCPPFYRGEEVSEEVIKSEYFVGYEFKKYLLPVQQAIVCYLLKDDNYTEKFLDVGDAKIRLINEMELITGFKYLKRGALKKVVKDVVFEIEFHSSHWNFYGQSIEVTADLRVIYKPYYKKYGKYPSDNIVAGMGYHPKNAYWYDITTEEKLLEVSKILGQQLKETAVDLVNRFEDDYEDAIKYLIGEGYEKYHVYLDFVADTLGQDIIKDRVKEICDGLSDENKEEIVRYRNGARDKAWMLNRCDLRYIVDNNLV